VIAPRPEPRDRRRGSALAAVVPAAPDSPWLEAAIRSVRADGVERVFVVSEGGRGPGERVAVSPDAGFAARANAGLAAARSAGFAAALLLNDDTEVLPGTTEALASALRRPAVAVAGAVLLDWDRPSIQQAGIRVGRRSGRVRLERREPTRPISSADAVGGAAMALDLAALDRLGGFEERFGFYLEDVDLCLRARRAGLGVVVVRDARVRHRGGGTRDGRSGEAAWHLGRSHALLARRLGGGPVARAARLVSVAGLGLAWSARSVGAGGPRRFVAGWLAGLRI